MAEIAVPELSLVVLVGVTGSGKSTFAREHFRPTSVVSSDACRGIVSDDENDQSATAEAFALLRHIVGVRLRRGLRTVVDATSVQPAARAELVALAREHDVPAVAIVFDVPESVCRERNAARPERAGMRPGVVSRQRRELRAGLRSLEREGFRGVHVLRGVERVESAVVRDERMWNDRRELTGPFDVIGDVHGCRLELERLLAELGYVVERDERGRAVGAAHPAGRVAVFVGDLVDRGPDTPGVLRLVMGMTAAGSALCVAGNHEHKLVRALDGRKVAVTHGLAESLAQLAQEGEQFQVAAREFCRSLVSHYVLDGGRLVVAHAGLKQAYHGRASARVRAFALYGQTTGETDEYGLPVRQPWADDYRGAATVLYGHTPTPELAWVNNTLCLDTGVVFGGRLTALRYPERTPVSVPAERVWFEPARPLALAADDGARQAPARRDPGLPRLADVVGRRVVRLRDGGRIGVGAEQAAAALEVMSRFAIDPRWLVYLPPTMAPCASSARPELLEHPDEAFAAYAAEGVAEVMCEEKHMGSRVVLTLARSPEAAARVFGVDDGRVGVAHTRTGRPFFADERLGQALAGRARAAVAAAGVFAELDADWVTLDAELMPWSAKAVGLLREQHASVGAAARACLGDAARVLDQAAGRGLDVRELAERTRARLAAARAFAAAYRRYCWPVTDLAGVRLAPFSVLASTGACHVRRERRWHLELADRLVAADPDLFAVTRRRLATLADPAARAAAVGWWEELTAAGGEGMVVKPAAWAPTAAGQGPQPGLKCRGREYLRLVYGPEYTMAANLSRLRRRGVGRKRSLALREHALGVEALERFAAGEPLWRVHEAVFAVLALESEPVDPRL